ncbi:hypothetical protein B0T16DRAFT_417530 [Cercophora newfieldiana]|uniref:Apple domain-containing protein n=1 Tax=Cercophora newfieldiana TaxID=92897 RepID=A0AA40CMY2_9PEZI|nr:hypothetical protein B0T16DRAFT_417530 [Cercophora newfieldiana]
MPQSNSDTTAKMGAETKSILDSQKEVSREFQGGLEVVDEQYLRQFSSPTKQPYSAHPSEADSEHFYPHFSHLPPIPPMTPLPPAPAEQRILGLRRNTFILSAALVAVIIAAVIGGGVGGALSVKRAETRCQEYGDPLSRRRSLSKRDSRLGPFRNQGFLNSPTATVTVTVVTTGAVGTTILPATATIAERVAVPTSGVLALDCPAVSGTTLGVDMAPDPEVRFALQCGVDLVGSGPDILAFTAYSLTDCLRACASLNRNNGSRECKGAVFSADMASIASRFGTCTLKRASAGQVKVTDPSLVDLYAAGVLVT